MDEISHNLNIYRVIIIPQIVMKLANNLLRNMKERLFIVRNV